MHKLMWRFVTTTKKKKKIPDPNLDTACPAGIPRKNQTCSVNSSTSSLQMGFHCSPRRWRYVCARMQVLAVELRQRVPCKAANKYFKSPFPHSPYGFDNLVSIHFASIFLLTIHANLHKNSYNFSHLNRLAHFYWSSDLQSQFLLDLILARKLKNYENENLKLLYGPYRI